MRAPRAPRVDLAGKKVVVTGAAPGSIGGETASLLGNWGADVVTTTRTGGSQPLDLTDPGSVRGFAEWYAATHGALDVLVNNAGVHLDLMSSWKEPHLLADGQEVHWRTNYLGTMHLTQLLLPALLATPDARVVNVVSKLHHRGTNAALFEPRAAYSSWNAYGDSKLALVHATRELQRRHGLRAYALHPGAVFTDIATKGLAGHRVVGAVRRVARPLERRFLLTAEEGAQTSAFCATQPDLPGGYYDGCAPARASAQADDAEVSARLWDQTQEWLSELP
jgi:NAD(P)-dependent dehydrogenase (short-subunit alcohol dehydrogenase family)